MKLFTLLMLLGFAQLSMTQDLVTPKRNAMSNVFALTAEGGVTLGMTDYTTNKMDYMAKGSLEYYFPSSGQGNFGLRFFGQRGFIAGQVKPPAAVNSTDQFSTRLDMYGGGVFYTLSIGDAVYPWLAVGVSNLYFYPQDANGKNLPNYDKGNVYNRYMLAYNGDAGVKIFVSKHISFNLMGGIIIGSRDFLDDIEAGPSNDYLYTATAGLSYYFGRNTDSDGDGVTNSNDACPDTPMGVKVDENGCPLDSDGDGVPDYLDKCSDTPGKVKVDANGCPIDSDGDGVPDYMDKCSNTGSGVKVDMYGCPVDSDKDGVADYLDKCANTPIGVKVDLNGCPVDSDGDGVADNLDNCPNTPRGVQVDSKGCPIKKDKDTVVITKPAEIETLVLSGDTNFEFNKSKLLPNAYVVLADVLVTMKEHPKYKWEVGGYTDGVGSAKYNKNLSKQRAQAIVNYLVKNGVKRNNLKIVGYGKDNPIATNETVEGRSMNRRVEIKLLSKDIK